MKVILGLFLILVVSGCASGLTEQQCNNVDSFELGRIDGSKGRPASLVDGHLKNCPGIDKHSYSEGHSRGITQYCTPELAFYEGKIGASNYNSELCNQKGHDLLLSEYKKGRRLHILNSQKQEIDQKIAEEREAYQKDRSVVGDAKKIFHLVTGSSPTDRLQRERREINEEILAVEGGAPVSSVALDLDMANTGYAMKVAGAAVGTVLGFGTGHAIQGRYKSSGWKWTLGDSAAMGALIVATNHYCESVPNHGPSLEESTSTQQCSNSIPLLTMLGLVGIRIWQSVDLWTNLGPIEYQKFGTKGKSSWTILVGRNNWPVIAGSF